MSQYIAIWHFMSLAEIWRPCCDWRRNFAVLYLDSMCLMACTVDLLTLQETWIQYPLQIYMDIIQLTTFSNDLETLCRHVLANHSWIDFYTKCGDIEWKQWNITRTRGNRRLKTRPGWWCFTQKALKFEVFSCKAFSAWFLFHLPILRKPDLEWRERTWAVNSQ